MLSTRRAVAGAVVLGALVATPSWAAAPKLAKAKPLKVLDMAGDANGLNSQSHVSPADPNRSGPGQRTAADIRSLSLGRLDDGRTVTGLKAVFNIGAAPDQGTIYRIQASTPACAKFWISYNVPVGGPISANLVENCTGPDVTTPMVAKVTGSTITISMPFKVLPKAVKLGVPITGVFGETKGHAYTGVRNPTAPTIDETEISPSTYKIGS